MAATSQGSEPGALRIGTLQALPTAVRRRVLRAAAIGAGCPAGALSAAHVTAVDALVTSWHGQGPLDLPGGVRASRRCDSLLLWTSSTSPGTSKRS